GLLAVDIDFLDHRDFEQPPLDVLGDVGELPLADAVALHGVEQPGHVAVFVVEDWADDAVGQLELDVAELLARLVPRLALVRMRRAAAHGYRRTGEALPGVVLDLLEMVELLELLLHAVQPLVLHLLGGGARPDHDRRHRGHRKVRILELAEPAEAQHAAEHDREDQEQNNGAMVERPLREIERFHRAACVMFSVRGASVSATRKRGAIFWTPAVTTNAPAGGPDTSTKSLRYPWTWTGTSSTVPAGSLPDR